MAKAVASKRHFAVLQEVARACELSDVQHVVEPSAVLEDPNGTGVKIELDLLMRDSAGMLLGIDATVGTWDKENTRKGMVRGKMEGYGTVGARQVGTERGTARLKPRARKSRAAERGWHTASACGVRTIEV